MVMNHKYQLIIIIMVINI